MDGLLKMIELRGGFETLGDQYLRIVLSWYVEYIRLAWSQEYAR
jgi:hypothetical protein